MTKQTKSPGSNPDLRAARLATSEHTTDALRRLDSVLGQSGTPQEEYLRAIARLRSQVTVLKGGYHTALAEELDLFLAVAEDHIKTGVIRFHPSGR